MDDIGLSGALSPSLSYARYGPEAPEHWSPWRKIGKQEEKPQTPQMLAVCGKQLSGYSRQDTGATDINLSIG